MPLLGALLAAPVEDPELAEGRNAPHRSVFLFPSARVWTVRICFILSTSANAPETMLLTLGFRDWVRRRRGQK
jgi:hypothetical protein